MGRAPHSYARPLSRGVVIMQRRSAPGYAGGETSLVYVGLWTKGMAP